MEMIDLILLKKETKIKTKDVGVLKQPECGSDHYMVVGKFICTRRIDNTKKKKANTDQLQELHQESHSRFKERLMQRNRQQPQYTK